MSFGYSALTCRGKVSLPSSGGWGTDMGIIRDPPRSYTTAKLCKVGDNTAPDIEDAGDRIDEALTRYARGVNPFVDVQYSGSYFGGKGVIGNGNVPRPVEAYSSRPVLKDGVFRPPIVAPQSLEYGLSRMPRQFTSANSAFEKVDFSLKPYQAGTADSTVQVKNAISLISVQPTKQIFLTSVPSTSETTDVQKSIVSNKIHVGADSVAMSTTDRTTTTVSEPRWISTTHKVKTNASTNGSDSRVDLTSMKMRDAILSVRVNDKPSSAFDTSFVPRVTPSSERRNVDVTKFIHDKTKSKDVFSALSKATTSIPVNINPEQLARFKQIAPQATNITHNKAFQTGLKDVMDLFGVSDPQKHAQNKRLVKASYFAPKQADRYSSLNFVHGDVLLERNLPKYTSHTNANNAQVYHNPTPEKHIVKHQQNVVVRDISAPTTNGNGMWWDKSELTLPKLAQKISAGGFEGKVYKGF